MKKTVSFLVSGRGSNFVAVAKKIIAGEIKANLGVVISNKKKALALEKAKDLKMASHYIENNNFSKREEHEEKISEILDNHKTDLVVAAGYMRILSPFFIKKYSNRIINIHPALLPSFPGVNAQKQALDYGVKVAGCTTHFVDEGVDSGPIIMQKVVEVQNSDTTDSLAEKILAEEHLILTESVRLFCEGRLTVKGRKVIIS